MGTLRNLPRGEAHVIVVREEAVSSELLVACESLLSEGERIREGQFLREEDRRRHRIARVLQRVGLSQYAEVSPKDWVFVKGKYGRPEIVEPTQVDLRFNISHTKGLVSMLVARCDCGIDVENLDQSISVDEVSRVFSDAEKVAILSIPEPTRKECLLGHWTLKEAFLKAIGLGLSIPPEWVTGVLGESIALTLDPRLHEDARFWQLHQSHPTANHIMAVALKRGNCSDDLVLRFMEVLPSLCADDRKVVLAASSPDAVTNLSEID